MQILASGDLVSMKIGKKPKPESPEKMALVHHALENPIRRRMIILMVEGCLSVREISESVGPNMLGYHLHRLELAGLIEVEEDGAIVLTESGEAYGALVKSQAERGGAG
jgi:DNA-binding transcriptional ArsR family regulator